MLKHLMIAAALTLNLAACGDDDHDHEHAEEGLDSHACEHMTDGPYANVTAADAFDAAVEAFEAHHLVTVALVTMPSGAMGGFVQVTPPKSGHFRLMLDAEVPAMLHTADNTHIEWEGTEAPDGCDAGKVVYEVPELVAETPYLLVFGPTDVESVGFVMAHEDHYASEGDDHDHDHE